ncbi:MAG: ABC transporter permease subunit [Pseudomonadota bacterium]|nr:ABC transporter permease subunit [Pseudomonadota bacterium]
MNAFLTALATLGPALAAHVLLAASALGLGLAIALPLIVWGRARPNMGRIVLGTASLIQTIPTLALLALFYPLLLWLSALVGGGIPALGFLPSLLALALYAVLPILRNGVTGLAGLDPALREAADGLGMTRTQKLWWVEAPLVAPVVMAGVRTAAVWTIGGATLSTTVGQPSLGDPIFAGLQIQNWSLVLAGCFAAAALALVVDGVLALIEHGVAHRRKLPIWVGAAVLALGLAGAAVTLSNTGSAINGRQTITIGAKNFSEQYILAALIGDRLEAAGYTVRYSQGLGSAVIYRALAAGDIDVYVEYAGTLWTNQMARKDIIARPAMIAAISAWTRASSGVRVIGPLGFENAYAFAMRGNTARTRGIASLADLARQAPGLRLGSDLEFLRRPEWQAVHAAYGLQFAASRSYSPTFMYHALESGDVDVISAFSSDGRIAADGLTLLPDPRGAIPGYDALLLVSPAHARDQRFIAALRGLVGAIPVSLMQRANYMVDRDHDKLSPKASAKLLASQIRR